MYNIKNLDTIDNNYANGLLPQRNSPGVFYQDTSCRSNLADFLLDSENRRIIRKTDQYSFKTIPLSDFILTPEIQKQIHSWVKELGWDFPTSSIKTIFTRHIFNQINIWFLDQKPIAYLVCYSDNHISHAAYVFYDPSYSHNDLPIRIVLQFIIDCHQNNLKFAYLGRFSKTTGYYKRTMPGFEYYNNQQWQKL